MPYTLEDFLDDAGQPRRDPVAVAAGHMSQFVTADGSLRIAGRAGQTLAELITELNGDDDG